MYDLVGYYNPAIGRFTSEDPLGTNLNIIAEDSMNLKNESNLYKFVKNDGINKTDPYGLFISDLPRYMCGATIMKHYYSKMIKKNWIGADAYYHCMGSCMASKICGPDVSFNLGLLREITDGIRGKSFEGRDMKNNAIGISCPLKKPCHERCKPLAPNGMPFD